MNTINRSVSYNPQVAFSADKSEKKKETAIAAVKMSDIEDKTQLSTSNGQPKQQAKKKEGFDPVQGFNNFVSGCKKLWIGTSEYAKATLDGTAKGALAFFATGATLVELKRRVDKGGILAKFVKNPAHPSQWIERNAKQFFGRNEYTKNAFKFVAGAVLIPVKFILSHIPKSNVNKAIIAGGLGSIPIITSLYNASLNVSEKTAAVDHRYNTGHRNEK